MADVEMKFVWIPPGTFRMGSTTEDAEKPVHRVEISKGFYLGIFPVTQAQWRWAMGSDDRPVESVTWDDCQEFCARMRELTGKPIRLPTEAEWAYACRAGTTTDYYSGNGDAALKKVGWYDANSNKQTQPVGKLAANAFGLYDMHGNVWEWCQDWYGGYPDKDIKDPQISSSGSSRVLRGGCCAGVPGRCRAASRRGNGAAPRDTDIGCRVCFRLDSD